MDPRTKAFVAAWASGLITHGRAVIYKDLYENGPSTAREVYARTGLEQAILNRSRFTELEKMGVIERDGVKFDALTPTKTATTVWKWVPNFPRSLKSRYHSKRTVAKMEHAICNWANTILATHGQCACEACGELLKLARSIQTYDPDLDF